MVPEAGGPGAPGGAAAVTGATPAASGTVLWDVQPERRRAGLLRRAMRILAAAALLIVVLVGLRTMFVPRQPSMTGDRPGTTFPATQAAGVAARWATAYLTLVPTDAGRASRSRALALDSAKGVDAASSWNGTGAQQVVSVFPLGVDVDPAGTFATARVLAQVRPSATAASQWLTVAIPMATDGTRPVVTGPAAFIGTPTPGPAPRRATAPPAVDTQVTERTKSGATAFFRAYAGSDNDALAQASAPGARLAPLAGQVRLASLDGWSVTAGDSSARKARATVTWQAPTGSTWRQTYDLDLTAITAAGLTDWRVQSLTAATEGATQ